VTYVVQRIAGGASVRTTLNGGMTEDPAWSSLVTKVANIRGVRRIGI